MDITRTFSAMKILLEKVGHPEMKEFFAKYLAQSIPGGGGGVLRNPIAWGVLNPPPPFKNGLWGGFKCVFRRKHTIFSKKNLVVSFWTAHPKFRPSPQFSHC